MNWSLPGNARVRWTAIATASSACRSFPAGPNQLVVPTFKGGVFLYDADNGDLIWKTHVGVPYWTAQPPPGIRNHLRHTPHVLHPSIASTAPSASTPTTRPQASGSSGYDLATRRTLLRRG